MISLILTTLYLAKDTVNRWFSRISSPLARVLVVFFLSLCALFFLGTYVISVKVVRERIRLEGGDLVHAIISPERGESCHIPGRNELLEWIQADSWVLLNVGSVRTDERRTVPVCTVEFGRQAQILPLMAEGGAPTLVYPAGEQPNPGEGLADIIPPGRYSTPQSVAVRPLPAGHPLARMVRNGALLLLPDTAAEQLGEERLRNATRQVLLQVQELNSSRDIRRVENYLQNLIRLEGAHASVNSVVGLLEQMDVILSNQMQCRAAFCLGIVLIVGILLTSLAGMEYRQNEYIYTLMKSFGIHPILLVLNFLAENLLLVGISFAAALAVFMHSQEIILTQFFKLGEFRIGAAEIMPEIRLICAALLLCVTVSALPIFVAANREIGRVLK